MSVTGINSKELKSMLEDGNVELIDVRETYEFEEVHIKGAKLIPMSLVPLKMDEIDWSKKVVLYCRSGARSRMIANMLSGKGKDVFDLEGGVGGLGIGEVDLVSG